MSGDYIIETTALSKQFKGFTAVNSVNLKVKRGTVHALIGPNGAGKTTCFNLLTKFLEPTTGSIVFNGRDITRMAPADVARLGMVRSFQISAVFPLMSVLDNVRVALQRPVGQSFHFWRSETTLDQLNDRAMALLADVGDSVRCHRNGFHAFKDHGAAAFCEDANDGSQRAGLARAIAAQQGDDLATAHFKVHAVQHMRLAVMALQVAHYKGHGKGCGNGHGRRQYVGAVHSGVPM